MDQIVRDPARMPDGWVLNPADRAIIAAKHHASRLSFAVLLLFFRGRGRFPRHSLEIGVEAIAAIAKQVNAPIEPFDVLDISNRTLKRHRAEIRELLGFREATVADGEALADWLRDHAVMDSRNIDQLTIAAEARCRSLNIEPPATDRIERMIRAAINAFDDRFCAGIIERMPVAVQTQLDALLETGR